MSTFGIRTQSAGRGGSTQLVTAFITSLYSIQTTIHQVLSTFQKSGTTHSDFTDAARRFWNTYQLQAEEYDREFLVRHNGDADVSMIFAGLFCAVCATFVVLIQPQLGPDPDGITHALLAALIITMNGTIPAGLPTSSPSPPSSTILWSQSLLYASLGIGLYAALGAVMGKQWLNHYDRVGIRGSLEDRGKERQRKLEALMKWHFHSVLESLPFLLELSLFLFGIGLSAYLWDQQKSVGILYIVINAIGALLYVMLTIAAASFPDCPFQTPFSLRLRRMILFFSLLWKEVLAPILKRGSDLVQQRYAATRNEYASVVNQWNSKLFSLAEVYFLQPARTAWGSFSNCVTSLLHFSSSSSPPAEERPISPAEKFSLVRSDIENPPPEPDAEKGHSTSPVPPPPRAGWAKIRALVAFTRTPGDAEDQSSESGSAQHSEAAPEAPPPPRTPWSKLRAWFKGPKVDADKTAPTPPAAPTDPSNAASVAWILETCTDPSVEGVTLEYMLNINWPQNFDFRPLLDRFLNGFIDCFERDKEGDIVESLASTGRKPSSNTTYGKIFLFLYWHAHSVSPEIIRKWNCWLDKNHERKMVYNVDFVPRDELTYIYLLTMETIAFHSNMEHVIGSLLMEIPGPNAWVSLSQTTAVALSRFWVFALPSVGDEDEEWICFKHIIALSSHVPMVPAVLAHHNEVFTQAVGRVWKRGTLEEGDFDANAMLLRMSLIQDELQLLATSHDFFSLPYGRYVSGFLLLLSYCAQTSWDLRLSLRRSDTALWCLQMCQSVYAGVQNEDNPASLGVWSSCALRLALVIMDDTPANTDIRLDPLSGLLRGETGLLGAETRRVLTPHLPWIMRYVFTEREVAFSDTPGPNDPSLPITVPQADMREFVVDLLSIRFFVMAETYDHRLSPAARSLMPKSYYITSFPPNSEDDAIPLYGAMALAARRSLRSVFKMIKSGQTLDAQSLVVAWCPIYQLILGEACFERTEERVERVLDTLEILYDIAQNGQDILHGSSWENTWGIHNMILAYDKSHKGWLHDECTFTHTLSRILLTSKAVHHLATFDPTDRYEYDEGCDQRTAIAIACAAWGPSPGPVEGSSKEMKVIKFSPAAVENTLTILEQVSDDILKERACCIRAVVEHPRRGDEEFDYPPGDKEGRRRVIEVYRAFNRKMDTLRDRFSDHISAISIPLSDEADPQEAAGVSEEARSHATADGSDWETMESGSSSHGGRETVTSGDESRASPVPGLDNPTVNSPSEAREPSEAGGDSEGPA